MSGAFSQNDAKRLERRPPGTARRAWQYGTRRAGRPALRLCSRNRQTLAAGFCSLGLSVFTSLAAVVHEWNFNETSGTTIFDSVGAAHAQIVTLPGGGGYQLDGKRVRLDGGTRSNADYVLFPENTFDGLTNVSVEVWAIPHSFLNWGRVFDIGPGDGPDTTLKLIRVAFSQGANGELQRYGLWPAAIDAAQPTPVDREYHYVMTWSASGALSFYRDGVLLGSQNTSPTNIATLAALSNTTFWLGRSHFTADSTANASYNKVRVHDTVLEAATIQANYRRGADDTFGLLHRWSFSETGGTNLADSAASATGSVVQLGTADFSLGSGQVTLAGGTRTSADYVSFPSRRLDGLSNMTIEVWATPTAARNWGRVVDIGDGITTDTSFLLSFSQGNDLNQQRLEFKPSGTSDSTLSTTLNTQYHYVIAWDSAAGECRWYRDGQFVTSFSLGAQTLANVPNAVFWLARSHYGADQTAAARYNEVRVYNRALLPNEIIFHFQQGPDSLALPPPVANNDSMILNPGAMALIPVLGNDTGTQLNPDSLTIRANPSSGSAQVKPGGKILYTHNGSPATSDQFSYTVNDAFGVTSSVATVSITVSNALRLPNTTLTIPNTPPVTAYEIVDAFPGLTFEDALALRSPPGSSNKLFVVERRGIISCIPDVTATNPTRQVFLNISDQVQFDNTVEGEMGLLSMEFHPGFATNGIFFVDYVAPNPRQDRVSRFVADPVALTVNTNTQQILFSVVDEAFNHNGGDLHFGPDGYLYVGMGDEGDQYNFRQNSQRIDKDFYSGLLRIDVDKKPGSIEPTRHSAIPTNGLGQAFYSIPPDNPWVGATQFLGLPINPNALRAEFFAVGFRHIWRFSIDPPTGEIWVGDVGQDTYEEVDLVQKGLNYGWAYYEALTPAISLYPSQTTLLINPPPSFTNTPPLWFYPHTGIGGGDPNYKGNSISGGVVYRGSRIPELTGAYIFGDFESANLWALSRTNSTVSVQRLAGVAGAAAFGHDPGNGDLLIANYAFNKVQRLVKTDAANASFPTKLSDTGIFADLATFAPNPGIVNYDPIVPFWSDHAIKRRWFCVPDMTNTVSFAADGNWTFPSGMNWIKHFDLELERGNPATKKRIETRVLTKTGTGAFGVSYAWNDAGTDAYLVPDAGTNFNVNVLVGSITVTQQVEIPSRAACLVCHTPVGGHALSFNTREMNRSASMNGFPGNQLTLLSQAGYFNAPVPAPQTLPAFATATDASRSLEWRVRSYLAVNCIQCHQPGGSGSSTWNARPEITLAQTGLINGEPDNNGANPLNKLIVPGDTAHSVLLRRILGNGFTRMPPLATHELDQGAINLLTAWISSELTNRQSFAQWQIANFGSTNNPSAAANADPDNDGANNYYEFLTRTSPLTNAPPPWTITIDEAVGTVGVNFLRLANLGFLVETSTDFANWNAWDVPRNQLYFGASNILTTVSGPRPSDDTNRFFRVKIFEP